ncbi:MAG TPA: hypothetical protein VIX14_03235 [Terriglobales bacterium]
MREANASAESKDTYHRMKQRARRYPDGHFRLATTRQVAGRFLVCELWRVESLFGIDEVRMASRGHTADEIYDALPRGAFFPGRKRSLT